MPSLLVTNDFPPKVGGIQNYLWELWSRQADDQAVVLTTPHPGAADFDVKHDLRVIRTREPWLRPTKSLVERVNSLAAEMSADFVFLDPISPLGSIGPRLGIPYVVILHGAEVNIPGRIPVWRRVLRRVLEGAEGVVSAGQYALAEAERLVGRSLASLVVPPGVDTDRFRPADEATRSRLRAGFGFPEDEPLVLGASRLVPRKGFDRLIQAVGDLDDVHLLLVGAGRDRDRLESRASSLPGRVRFAGSLTEERLVEAYQAADVFAMPCRSRWFGLEQEGFGIVYNEAAAVGLPAIAGRSGGTDEAVIDGETGLVVDGRSTSEITEALSRLTGDSELTRSIGSAARDRVVRELSYPVLARSLAPLVAGDMTVLSRPS